MATEKTATATWEGSLAAGHGSVDLGSGAASGLQVTWKDRAEGGEGTSPEELIAAAPRRSTSRSATSSSRWSPGGPAATRATRSTSSSSRHRPRVRRGVG